MLRRLTFQAFLAHSSPQITEHLVLVPYRRKYVHRYHEWMKDPFLQEATASEPLTLEEEYAMQASWRDDEKSESLLNM